MSLTVEYIPLKLVANAKSTLPNKLPDNWTDVRLTLNNTNTAIANGIRRTALLYMDVPTLFIDYADVTTTDDLVIKLLPDIRTKISQLKLDYRMAEPDNASTRFMINVTNNTQYKRVITSSDIVTQKNNDILKMIPKNVQLFTLAKNTSVKIPITVRVAKGIDHASNIFTRSIRYKDLDYVDIYRMNYTGNLSLIRAEKKQLQQLITSKKVKVLRNAHIPLDQDPPMLFIPNKSYLLKMSKVYLDGYAAGTNITDAKHTAMSADDIIAKLSGYFARYALVILGLSDEVDRDDDMLYAWSSTEANPTNYQIMFRLWGNIPGKIFTEKLISCYTDKLQYVLDNLENPSVVERTVTFLEKEDGSYEVTTVRLFNEDETVANAIKYAMFELDPEIPLVYCQRPCNAERIIEIVYIHPDKNIIIKSIQSIIATLQKFKADLK